jgi:hypothetical protein
MTPCALNQEVKVAVLQEPFCEVMIPVLEIQAYLYGLLFRLFRHTHLSGG